MYPITPLVDSLRSAFHRGDETIGFDNGDNEYLIVARYDESPFVKVMLFVWDDEINTWIVIADSGREYTGARLPEPWKGLPDFIAEKIAGTANLHTVIKAREALVEMGLVQDSGRRQNGQVVWEITPLGKHYAERLPSGDEG